jgi:hypothetical protein
LLILKYLEKSREMEACRRRFGLLTVYDMCKAVDKGMVMTDVRLLENMAGNLAIGPPKYRLHAPERRPRSLGCQVN